MKEENVVVKGDTGKPEFADPLFVFQLGKWYTAVIRLRDNEQGAGRN